MTGDYTVEVQLPPHKRGDRWPGMLIGPIKLNGLQPEELLKRVRCYFKHLKGKGVFRLDSDPGAARDSPIVISDETEWRVTVPKIQEFLPEDGDWAWDMEFYDVVNSGPLTFYKGVLEVGEDVTDS